MAALTLLLAWDIGNGDVLTGDGPGTSEDDPSATYVYELEAVIVD